VKQRPEGQVTAGTRSRVSAVLWTLSVPILAYAIARNAALTLSPQVALAAGGYFPPASNLPQVTLLARAAAIPQTKIGEREVALAKRTLGEAPLASEPFLIAAAAAERAGDTPRAIRLLEEAKRRRANRTSTRLQLLGLYGKARSYPAFLREMDYVLRRSEKSKAAILPQLVKALPDPGARAPLADLLAKEPSWRADFYGIAGKQNVDPRHARALIERVRTRKPGGNMAAEEAFYMQTLLSAGQFAPAKQAWARMNGIAAASLVTDPGFEGVKASGPFIWTTHDVDVGRAGIVPRSEGGPRLEVEYVGGRPVMLAEQTLALAPGGYRLSFSVRGEAPPRSSLIFWRVSCTPGDRELARVETGALQGGFVARSGRFAVPVGCPGQTLRLFIEPGDFPAPASISFGKVDVTRG
jgi:hypothetical protein